MQPLSDCSFVSCLCDNGASAGSRNWSAIARRIKLPYDDIRDYHPQFEGYRPGTVIKQADTVLLGFPLQYPGLKPSTRSNDLRTYESVTRSTGPAMTWAMHAINHLDLGELQLAAINFNHSYQPYVRGPFHVWYELQQPETGAQNFLTGTGGFLQAILFGYAGVRVHLDRLEIRATTSESPMELNPPGSSGITAKGLRYLGALITIAKTINQSEVVVTNMTTALTIELSGEDTAIDVIVNETYFLNSRTAIIRPKNVPYRGCDLPEDLIGG
ncbi:hypothetical protein ZHAS_00009069 [Anopheles sinensis]|uniref:Glycoside hydrolase family 65 central catalytic domain-containing protein n=1 Tax=Anopheles sinensis TaxID=74873 RepID=A0A084VU33_ANOSI|nr:hypothetical protein ZHAS_00009069 [Anopheles sinensis]